MNQEEKVLVIPRSLFNELGSFQGVSKDISKYLPIFLSTENLSFLIRNKAEKDENFKQLIPYSLFRKDGKYLFYSRGKSGGEQRLHTKKSLGIGGHINSEDFMDLKVDKNGYEISVHREIEEELDIEGKYEGKIIGILNDDSTEVGKVHLGIIHLFEIQSGSIQAREEAISSLNFAPLSEIKEKYYNKLETWSQLCVDFLLQENL